MDSQGSDRQRLSQMPYIYENLREDSGCEI
jgi:hypothetical protein